MIALINFEKGLIAPIDFHWKQSLKDDLHPSIQIPYGLVAILHPSIEILTMLLKKENAI